MAEEGKPTAIYMPKKLNDMIEITRKQLGMTRSRFVQYALTRLLQELNVLQREAEPVNPH
ncbi:MAG: hypothetical protein QW279_13470 [Candidatus Jordarchaeaceae archaeon]